MEYRSRLYERYRVSVIFNLNLLGYWLVHPRLLSRGSRLQRTPLRSIWLRLKVEPLTNTYLQVSARDLQVDVLNVWFAGRIFGMQVTSPEPQPSRSESPKSDQESVVVSPASVEMLSKLFPTKKRGVLELVLKRCNHDLLKAIEHFNLSHSKQETEEQKLGQDGGSAFKPIHSKVAQSAHQSSLPLVASSKVFMHSLYPFLPLFNPQPVLPSSVYVPGFCECEQCKHGLYARLDPRL